MNGNGKKKFYGFMGLSADPVHNGHLWLAEELIESQLIEKLFIVIAGDREDKALSFWKFRKEMADAAFAELVASGKAELVHDDIYGVNRPTVFWYDELLKRNFGSKLFFCASIDLVIPKEELGGVCEIIKFWKYGHLVYNTMPTILMDRGGYPVIELLDLPNNFLRLKSRNKPPKISSTTIKKMIRLEEDISRYVPKEVAEIIRKKRMYKEK